MKNEGNFSKILYFEKKQSTNCTKNENNCEKYFTLHFKKFKQKLANFFRIYLWKNSMCKKYLTISKESQKDLKNIANFITDMDKLYNVLRIITQSIFEIIIARSKIDIFNNVVYCFQLIQYLINNINHEEIYSKMNVKRLTATDLDNIKTNAPLFNFLINNIDKYYEIRHAYQKIERIIFTLILKEICALTDSNRIDLYNIQDFYANLCLKSTFHTKIFYKSRLKNFNKDFLDSIFVFFELEDLEKNNRKRLQINCSIHNPEFSNIIDTDSVSSNSDKIYYTQKKINLERTEENKINKNHIREKRIKYLNKRENLQKELCNLLRNEINNSHNFFYNIFCENIKKDFRKIKNKIKKKNLAALATVNYDMQKIISQEQIMSNKAMSNASLHINSRNITMYFRFYNLNAQMYTNRFIFSQKIYEILNRFTISIGSSHSLIEIMNIIVKTIFENITVSYTMPALFNHSVFSFQIIEQIINKYQHQNFELELNFEKLALQNLNEIKIEYKYLIFLKNNINSYYRKKRPHEKSERIFFTVVLKELYGILKYDEEKVHNNMCFFINLAIKSFFHSFYFTNIKHKEFEDAYKKSIIDFFELETG